MNFLDITTNTQRVLQTIENLVSRIDNYSFLDTIGIYSLKNEVGEMGEKWRKQIRKAFDDYFIKQANIQVLRRAEKEIEP